MEENLVSQTADYQSTDSNKLKVVFAGFGRSGTTSLTAALERLGFNPCHGTHIVTNIRGSHYDMSQAIIDQDVPKLIEITESMGYDSTLELHSNFWREIRELRPNAKYIIILRPYEKWENSVNTIQWTFTPIKRYPLLCIPTFYRFNQVLASYTAFTFNMTMEEGWDHWKHHFSEEATALRKKAHETYVRDAKKFAEEDPEHAFIFNLKDGYAPLCEFLNVPVPDEKFPHLNQGYIYTRVGRCFRFIEFILYCLPIGIILLVLWGAGII